MTNGTVPAGQLQEEQAALMARIQEEPSTAHVMEALERAQGYYPAAFAFPTTTSTYGSGTNFNG